MIADQDMATINCKILKENSEEIYLQGPLGKTDVRIINSYPSKVSVKLLSVVGKVGQAGKSRASGESRDMRRQTRHASEMRTLAIR